MLEIIFKYLRILFKNLMKYFIKFEKMWDNLINFQTLELRIILYKSEKVFLIVKFEDILKF